MKKDGKIDPNKVHIRKKLRQFYLSKTLLIYTHTIKAYYVPSIILNILIHWVLTKTLFCRCCSHFTDRKTEPQKINLSNLPIYKNKWALPQDCNSGSALQHLSLTD